MTIKKITMSDIRHHKRSIKESYDLSFNIPTILKQASTNVRFMNEAVKVWKEFSYDENKALSMMVGLINKSIYSDKDCNRYLNVVAESITDIKKATPVLKHCKACNETTLAIANRKANIQRVVRNQTLLERYIKGLPQYVREARITSAGSESLLVAELCRRIDNLNIKPATKYIVSMENVLYSLNLYSPRYLDDKTVLEMVVDYYLINNESTVYSSLAKALNETELYDDEEKEEAKATIDNVVEPHKDGAPADVSVGKSNTDNTDDGDDITDDNSSSDDEDIDDTSIDNSGSDIEQDDHEIEDNNSKDDSEEKEVVDKPEDGSENDSDTDSLVMDCKEAAITVKSIIDKAKGLIKPDTNNKCIKLITNNKIKEAMDLLTKEVNAAKTIEDLDKLDKERVEFAKLAAMSSNTEWRVWSNKKSELYNNPALGPNNIKNIENSVKERVMELRAFSIWTNKTYAKMIADKRKTIKMPRPESSFLDYYITEDVSDKVKEFGSKAKDAAKNVAGSFKSKLDELKGEKAPSKDEIREFLKKNFYGKNEEQAVNELPNILAWIRRLAIASVIYINPFLAIISLIIDYYIDMTISREKADEIIEKLEKEIKEVDSQISNAKNDKQKENLEAYKKELKDKLDAMEKYASDLHTDEENDKRLDDKWAREEEENKDSDSSKSDDDDSDDDWGEDWDMDWDEDDDNSFDESVRAAAKGLYLCELVESYVDNVDLRVAFSRIMACTKRQYDRDFSETVIALNKALPNVLSNMKRVLEREYNARRGSRELFIESTIIKYDISRLVEPRLVETINGAIVEMTKANMAAESLQTIMHELSFASTIELTKEKIKKAAQNLSDKDKIVSTQIDRAVDKLGADLNQSITNKNREAVIAGKIIPSASAALKICLGSAAISILINPALAIIGILGTVGLNMAATKKERQLILDEIDVQLKVIEKRISNAESDGKMDDYEYYLKMQQKLKREKLRIAYKMKDRVYVTSNKNDD